MSLLRYGIHRPFTKCSNLWLFVLGSVFFFYGCAKKGIDYGPPPAALYFELVNKSGISLVKSVKDSVKLYYTDGGILKSKTLIIQKLPVSVSDTTAVERYNGLAINDDMTMQSLSQRAESPVHDFAVYLNKVKLGDFYYNGSDILFNKVQVKSELGFKYYIKGFGLFVVQTL